MAKLIYGSGMRLMECVRLHILDVDFGQRHIFIRAGKGGRDRTTIMPRIIYDELRQHIELVKDLHRQNCEEGAGEVHLSGALAKKCRNAPRQAAWQYVFPAKQRSIDPRSEVGTAASRIGVRAAKGRQGGSDQSRHK